MKNQERFLVYGALATLAAIVAFNAPAHTSTLAPAAPLPGDGLALAGKTLGAVDSDKLMKLLLKSDRLAEERRGLEDEARKKEEEFAKRLRELRDKYKDVEGATPERQKDAESYQNDYRDWRNEMTKKFATMQSAHIEKSYRELVAAVDVIAERQKVDIVIKFVPVAGKLIDAEDAAASPDSPDAPMDMLMKTMDQVRARTLLHYPDSIDITAEVMKELNLKQE
jgi:Skp family chaperone for outer membrane proteins